MLYAGQFHTNQQTYQLTDIYRLVDVNHSGDKKLQEAISATARPNRRPSTGGYPNGEETRRRLIEAAIAVLRERGFENASTREITARAGVKSPALPYYFGGKVGLYQACVELVTDKILARLRPALDESERCVQSGCSTTEAIGVYCRLQDGIIDSMYTPDEGGTVKLLIWSGNRHRSAESEEISRLVDRKVNAPCFAAASGIVGLIMARPREELETGLVTAGLFGLLLGFYQNEEQLFHALAWTPADAGNTATLKATLRRQATILLKGLARPQKPAR